MTSEEFEGIVREVAKLRQLVEDLLPKPPPDDGYEEGDGVKIDPSCRFVCNSNAPIRIGAHTQVWRGAEWLGPVTVGERVFINRNSYIRSSVTIEDDVSLGPFVRLISDSHDIGMKQRRTGTPRVDPIVVGRGSWIGAGAIILGGVRVGSRSIVAAGSVVTQDVPDNVVVGGVPARIVKKISDCGDMTKLVPVGSGESLIRMSRRHVTVPKRLTMLRARNAN